MEKDINTPEFKTFANKFSPEKVLAATTSREREEKVGRLFVKTSIKKIGNLQRNCVFPSFGGKQNNKSNWAEELAQAKNRNFIE
jgi:hypothetical protein